MSENSKLRQIENLGCIKIRKPSRPDGLITNLGKSSVITNMKFNELKNQITEK